jgi:hypothetical protein
MRAVLITPGSTPKEKPMPTTRLKVQIHPAALLPDDVLLTDPDAPDREIEWRIGAVRKQDDVVVADYVTEDGTAGTHGFEDPGAWLTVAARTIPAVAA